MSVRETTTVPPRVEALLQSLGADPELADDILGDLAEEFEVRRRWDGEKAARRWYYREACRTAPHLLRDWREHFRFRDAVPLTWALLAYFAAETTLTAFFVRFTDLITGVPLTEYLRQWQLTGDRVLWLAGLLIVRQVIPPMIAGATAGTIGKRTALPSSLLVAGAILTSMATVVVARGIPLRPLIVGIVINAGLLSFGCLAGGAAAVLWMRRRASRSDSPVSVQHQA